jgi:hypothetical protein
MSARLGSLKSVNKLGLMVDGNGALFEQVLPIIYQHLDVSKIPSNPGSSGPDKATEIAQMSLFALFQGIDDERLETPRIVSNLLDHWPMIWDWSSFLVTQYVEKDTSKMDEGFRFKVHFITTSLFSLLASQPELCRTMASTPGLVSMMTRLWISESDIGDRPVFASSALRHLLVQFDMTCIRDFMVTISGNESDVAKMCLQRVEKALSGPTINDLELCGVIGMILCSAGNHQLSHALLANHSISVIARVMSRLTCGKPPYSVSLMTCLKYCTMYLESFLPYTDGFTWIIQAVEGHLIMTILTSEPLLKWDRARIDPDDIEQEYTNLLRNIIAPYLVYRSVLRQVAKSVKKAKALNLDSRMRKSGPLWDAWLLFKQLVEERMEIKAFYDDTRWLRSGGCENIEVFLIFLEFIMTNWSV